VQLIEVHTEHVYDLLAPRQSSLQLKLDYKSQVIIPDARTVLADSSEAAIDLFQAGLAARRGDSSLFATFYVDVTDRTND
jgi:hypothetical protein